MNSNDLNINTINESKNEILVKEKEERVDNKNILKITEVEELKKYIPDLKEISILKNMNEDYYDYHFKKSDSLEKIWNIKNFNILEKIGLYCGFGIIILPFSLSIFLYSKLLFFFYI